MKFLEWFIKQHGERPSQKHIHELHNEYLSAQQRLMEIQNLYLAVERWAAQKKSARYAWNIFDNEKEPK